jgi:hypothetical protein
MQYTIPDPELFPISIPSFFVVPDNDPARRAKKSFPHSSRPYNCALPCVFCKSKQINWREKTHAWDHVIGNFGKQSENEPKTVFCGNFLWEKKYSKCSFLCFWTQVRNRALFLQNGKYMHVITAPCLESLQLGSNFNTLVAWRKQQTHVCCEHRAVV